MMMKPRLRRLMLLVHVVTSVGWFGAAAAYAGLVAAALGSLEPESVRAAYLSITPIMWFAIVPLAIASLLTGLIQSLGTSWGLIRHYWVVFKLVLTVLITIILLMNTESVRALASAAAGAEGADATGLKSQLVHAVVGMLVLLVTTMLGVYKPRGMTPYGWRKQRERDSATERAS